MLLLNQKGLFTYNTRRADRKENKRTIQTGGALILYPKTRGSLLRDTENNNFISEREVG